MRVLALAVVLLAAPAFAAELPVAGATMELAGSLATGLRPGATGAATVEAKLAAEGFACAQEATVTVAFLVDDSRAAEGVVLRVENSSAVTIPAGAYPAGQPWTATLAPAAGLFVARSAPPGSSSEFTVKAAVAAVEPAATCTIDRLATLAAEAKLATKLATIPPGDPAFHPDHEAHGGFVFDKVLKPGESFEWTPESPGRYPYHDHFQPEKKGLVRVLRVAEGAASPVVRITKEGFLPADLAVKVGTPVRWVNEDSATRTVSADEQHGVAPVTEPEDEAAEAKGDPAPKETPLAPFLAAAAALAGALARRR